MTKYLLIASLAVCSFFYSAQAEEGIRIGSYDYASFASLVFVKDDAACFVMNPNLGGNPGMAAPDDSIHKLTFRGVDYVWGRVGDAVVGRLTSDHPVTIKFSLSTQWPGFVTQFSPEPGGVKGVATLASGQVEWHAKTDPAPTSSDDKQFSVAVAPNAPVHFVAGFGALPDFDKIDDTLSQAEQTYAKHRPTALAPEGDFIGAISDNLNNSRFYSSDNKMVAVSVSRGWTRGPNANPYFCWDSFFSALLATQDDPEMGHQTIRAILSCQTPEGLVPNFGHWKYASGPASIDRSQPPVGSLCVWKMHLVAPDDKAFLTEVYPKLVKWHEWWMVARNAKHDGLLEWGSSSKTKQGAQYETGWDDNVEYADAKMVGTTMNAYAVDLNSLWSMDAHYLSLIADAIGNTADAAKFRQEETEMNQRINDKLWNPNLGTYCSRLWDDGATPGKFLTRLTPMNFYPMICGAPDDQKAKQMLAIMTDPTKFWGEWVLPTASRQDPVFPHQQYWHGTIWGPVNFLVFQGIKRYASSRVQADFAQKSIKLFMLNWQTKGICGEAYFSSNGEMHNDAHYTWGALLCLVGLESIVHLSDDGVAQAGAGINDDVELHNICWGGQHHDVVVKNGKTTISAATP